MIFQFFPVTFINFLRKASFYLFIISFLSCGSDKRTNDRDRFFLLGNEALKKNEYKEAIMQYTEAIALDNDYADAYNNRGLTYLKRGDAGTALLDFNQALLIRDEVAFKWNRAEAYAALNRYDKAMADVTIVRKAYPDSAAVYFSEGLIHFQFQQLPEAEAAFSESLQRDPTNGEVYINRGTVRYYRGKLAEAEEDLEKGLGILPEEANAWNTLALLEADKGNLPKAVEHIETALELSPNEAFFLNNKGFILLKMEKLEEAAKVIDTSILIDPQNAWAYRNKGIYFYKTQQYEEALRLLEKAQSLDPETEGVYFWLGRTYLAKNDVRKACEALQKAEDNEEVQSLRATTCAP